MISSVDIGWTAGIIDGEGCIKLQLDKDRVDGGHHTNLVTQVQATCRGMVEKLQQLWGGSVITCRSPSRAGQKPVHCWTLAARGSVEMLELIEPYLVEKAEQAFFALLHQETMTRSKRPIPSAVRTFRLELNQRLSRLKREIA